MGHFPVFRTYYYSLALDWAQCPRLVMTCERFKKAVLQTQHFPIIIIRLSHYTPLITPLILPQNATEVEDTRPTFSL